MTSYKKKYLINQYQIRKWYQYEFKIWQRFFLDFMIFLVPSTGTLHSLRDLSLKIYVNLDNFLGNNFHTTLLVLTFSSLPKTLFNIATPKSHHKMPALIQQTTNVYLNFAPFIINRGCKTDIKRSVHIGVFSQCFLLLEDNDLALSQP